MQQKDRSNYLNTIQKNLAASCFDKCSTRKPCLQICYKKYLAAVNTTNNAVRNKGYEALSKIALKGYPEDQINFLMYNSEAIIPLFGEASFAVKGNEKV